MCEPQGSFFIAITKEERKRMKNAINTIQIALSAFGGWLGWVLGGWDGFLYALVTFVVIDYLTGVMLAILEKRLSSEVGARGIFKKVLIFALVAVGCVSKTAETVEVGNEKVQTLYSVVGERNITGSSTRTPRSSR